MKKAQFATAAPRNYLQKGHSNATSQCNAAIPPCPQPDNNLPCITETNTNSSRNNCSRQLNPLFYNLTQHKKQGDPEQEDKGFLMQGKPQHVTIIACYNSTEIKTSCPGKTWRAEKNMNVLGKTTQKPPQNIVFIPNTKGLRQLIIFI